MLGQSYLLWSIHILTLPVFQLTKTTTLECSDRRKGYTWKLSGLRSQLWFC